MMQLTFQVAEEAVGFVQQVAAKGDGLPAHSCIVHDGPQGLLSCPIVLVDGGKRLPGFVAVWKKATISLGVSMCT